MGGKPWTSKACKNCKTSKVRCDLQKPQCGRCVRRGTPCPGYEERPFITTTFKPERRNQVFSDHSLNRTVTRLQPTKMTKMSQAINLGPAKCVQISSSYINLWFPMDNPHIAGVDRWFGKETWYQIFTHIQQIPNKSTMLERAISAISLVCLGKLHRDETLVEQGIWYYNSSIRRLLHMIQRNEFSEEIIFVTTIFQMLEVWYSPYGMDAFVAHENGTNACIKKLTADQASKPVMKLLIRDQRRLSVISFAISTDMTHPTPAAQPSEEDSLLDELFHFLDPVSKLVFESNKIKQSDWQAAKGILYAAFHYREEMLSWYARRKDDIGLPFYPQKDLPVTGLGSNSNHVFGTFYSFPNFESAAVHVVYWTGMVLVEELIPKTQTILSRCSDGGKSTNYTARHAGYEMTEFYADEACRAVPYCLSGASGTWGMMSLIGCFGLITKPYLILRRKEKLDYCIEFYQLAMNNGMGMAKCMSDYILVMSQSSSPPTGSWSLQPKNSDSESITMINI